MDLVKEVAAILDEARNANISVYVVAGSHDCSPSGKTMLDVLEQAGLIENVAKIKEENEKITLDFVEDKTGVKLTGLPGKRAGLEIEDYRKLNKENLEKEEGIKIFLFHTTLDEFKPEWLKQVTGAETKTLPKNFNYYAGGHVHYIFDIKKDDYGVMTYPGALFPNNFKELEEFKHGGFYLVNIENGNLSHEYINVKVKDVVSFRVDVEGLDADAATNKIIDEISKENFEDKIVTLRVKGVLKNSKASQIRIKDISRRLDKAYSVLRNFSKVTSEDIENIKIEEGSIEDVEHKMIKEAVLENDKLADSLLNVLNCEKEEGEKNLDFEKRLIKNVDSLLGIEDDY